MKKILLIDDSALMRRSVFDIIEKTGRYTVGYYASSFSEAVELLRKYNDISIVICSTFMHDTNVDKLFSATKSEKSHIHIISISFILVPIPRLVSIARNLKVN